MRLTKKDLCLTVGLQGFEISAMVDGYREHRLYIGYSKKEGIRKFLEEFNGGK